MLRFCNVFYTISKLSHCPANVFFGKYYSFSPNFVSELINCISLCSVCPYSDLELYLVWDWIGWVGMEISVWGDYMSTALPLDFKIHHFQKRFDFYSAQTK